MVPELPDLGIVGFKSADDPAARVRMPRDPSPDEHQLLVFCEGFAVVEGGTYCWEVWTKEEYELCSDGDDYGDDIVARIALLGDAYDPVEIVERFDGSETGLRWTQVVVAEPSFSSELLERMRTTPEPERSLLFSWVPDSDEFSTDS